MTIKDKVQAVYNKLRDNGMARLALETELEAIQEVCPHENVREWTHHDYIGDSDLHWQCSDCGKYKVTEPKGF